MSEILVPVSFGELLDKIAILQIKSERMSDQAKLANVRNELAALENTWSAHPAADKDIDDLRAALKAVNERLWVIEDDIRIKEKAQAFDEEFVRLARSVYFENDERGVPATWKRSPIRIIAVPGSERGGREARRRLPGRVGGRQSRATNRAVRRRTSGSTMSRAGKATSQDSIQALSHKVATSGARPTLRNVLIIDTMQVIRIDSSSGVTQKACRGGSLRRGNRRKEDMLDSVSRSIKGATRIKLQGLGGERPRTHPAQLARCLT
jgi:hypothetical protein